MKQWSINKLNLNSLKIMFLGILKALVWTEYALVFCKNTWAGDMLNELWPFFCKYVSAWVYSQLFLSMLLREKIKLE